MAGWWGSSSLIRSVQSGGSQQCQVVPYNNADKRLEIEANQDTAGMYFS